MAPDAPRYQERPALPLDPVARSLFAFTSPHRLAQLDDERLADHIVSVRDEAYRISPWPCFGAFRFLVPGIRVGPPPGSYQRALQRLTSDPRATVLDIGCGFGQDARALLQDGAKPEQVVAADLVPELMQLGCKLFGDEHGQAHLRGTRWERLDVFEAQQVDAVRSLSADGKGFDVIYAGSCIHLFNLEKQTRFAEVLASLLSPKSGSLILGRQVGSPPGEAGPFDVPPGWEERGMEPAFAHDASSFPKLFEGSGEWEFDVRLEEWESDEQMRRPRLSFAVTRK